MTLQRWMKVTVAAAVLGSCGGALGQETAPGAQPDRAAPKKDPRSDPGLSDPSLDDQISGHRRAGPAPAAVAPTPPKPGQRPVPGVPAPTLEAPGLSSVETGIPAGKFRAEGAFMAPTGGKLVRARTGELFFVPAPEGEKREPAMIIMGCQRLSQLDAAIAAPNFSGGVTLSGQVFVYHDRQYLLPTVFSLESGAREGKRPGKDTTPSPATTGPSQPDSRAEELMKELEAQRPPRALDPSMGTAPPPPTRTPGGVTLLQEGTLLVMRRGRLVRLPGEDGRYAFSLDNDTNSPAPPPLTLLPCAELTQLEGLASVRGEGLVFKISGRVTVYQGRDYLLPIMHQVAPTSEVTPMQ